MEHRADAVREGTPVPQNAYRYDASVGAGGKLELTVPLPPGTRVEVLVLTPEADAADDLSAAAGSSTDFWDNPEDDEDWNDA